MWRIIDAVLVEKDLVSEFFRSGEGSCQIFSSSLIASPFILLLSSDDG